MTHSARPSFTHAKGLWLELARWSGREPHTHLHPCTVRATTYMLLMWVSRPEPSPLRSSSSASQPWLLDLHQGRYSLGFSTRAALCSVMDRPRRRSPAPLPHSMKPGPGRVMAFGLPNENYARARLCTPWRPSLGDRPARVLAPPAACAACPSARLLDSAAPPLACAAAGAASWAAGAAAWCHSPLACPPRRLSSGGPTVAAGGAEGARREAGLRLPQPGQR